MIDVDQAPTQAALLALRDERAVIDEAYEFLDEKRLLLAAELLRQLTRYESLKLELDEFTRQAKKRLGEGIYERDGSLTEEALAELQRALPEVPAERLQPPLAAIALPRVLNVAVFVHLIQRKLAETEEKADHA